MSGESYIPQCSKSTSVQRAYAKINLSLDVTGKRADGYHLVDMIMQTVGIYDTLTVAESDDETDDSGAVSLSIEMENGGTLSAGEDNLICRAVRSMQKEFGIRKEFDIHLIKRIPIAAGMAGGSTDAAAAFRAVRDLSAPSVTDEKLAELAAGLGADIPYCIYGGTKRCRGIGEVLTEMPDAPNCSLVIVKPPVGVSTPWCYKTLDQTEITGRPDTEAMIRALDAHDLRAVMGSAGNVLESVTAAAHSECRSGKRPEIFRIRAFPHGICKESVWVQESITSSHSNPNGKEIRKAGNHAAVRSAAQFKTGRTLWD